MCVRVCVCIHACVCMCVCECVCVCTCLYVCRKGGGGPACMRCVCVCGGGVLLGGGAFEMTLPHF